MSAQTHTETRNHTGGLHFAFTVAATAVLTLILVPTAALGLSYLAGGAATSSILFVYIFALFTNAPFLVASFLIAAGTFAMPRLVANLAHHDHA
ncbi:hypothetical protein [Methyloferula stellata]|uniref:hypothetical protein n=1 Tax=Methyloferula stellata TaxID=876270 RepID=UPI00039A0EC5|nr:hypothetical protein [Methyloferula stellata]